MFPLILQTEHFSIQTIWIFVVFALLFSSWLAIRRLKNARANFNIFIEHGTWFLISAIFFSRFFHFFLYPLMYHPGFNFETVKRFFAIWDQGFSFWGAVFGFFLVLTFRLMKMHESIWKWYDSLMVPILLGLMIGRVGQFLSGSGYGTPSNLPWAIKYELMSVPYTVPVHPTQIYSFITIGILLWSKRLLRKRTELFKEEGNGTLFLVGGFCFTHFFLDFITGSDAIMLAITKSFSIHASQIGYLIGFFVPIGLLSLRTKKDYAKSKIS